MNTITRLNAKYYLKSIAFNSKIFTKIKIREDSITKARNNKR